MGVNIYGTFSSLSQYDCSFEITNKPPVGPFVFAKVESVWKELQSVGLNTYSTRVVRFGIGRFTTEEEVDYTVQKCIQHAKRLREMRYVENTFLR